MLTTCFKILTHKQRPIFLLGGLIASVLTLSSPQSSQAQNARTAEAFQTGRYLSCQGCDLKGVSLNEIKGGRHSSAKFRQSDLSDADLSNANFDLSHFTCAKLVGANLSNGVFTDANFIDANLSNTNLQGADFSRADLSGVILTGANLEGTKFAGAKLPNAKTLQTNEDNTDIQAMAPKRIERRICRAEDKW